MYHQNMDILIKNASLIRDNGPTATDILVSRGVITKIAPSVAATKHCEIFNAEGLLAFPGLIDCHVHFREPGLEHKATLATEAAAAVAGGVTTVCEMPNTIPPTVTVAALADKVRRANNIDDCDIRFYFGVTEPAHLQTLKELWIGDSGELRRLKARCSGLKLYLDHSTGNQKVDGGIVEEVFATCAKLKIPLIAHCEDPEMNAKAFADNKSTDIASHTGTRPAESEAKSIAMAIGLVEKTGCPLHVAHLSTKQGIELVADAKKRGLPVTCEVAPHHLFLSVEDYATLGAKAKMNPPVRASEHAQALWRGIADHTVDCIATDHAPHTLEEKSKGLQSPSGVPGVETMLPLMLSVVANQWPHPSGNSQFSILNSKFSYSDILRLCFTNPNRIFNLGKTGIREGELADIILIDPKVEWSIQAAELHSKCGWTPFENWQVRGKIRRRIA